jgi:aminoglycoside phosphotransferase (APT) family kinase protein
VTDNTGTRSVEALDIAQNLLLYVRSALHEPDASYTEEPSRFSAGVENRVFGLEFHGASRLRGPLVLKLFAQYVDVWRARCEGIVQNEIASQDFPAPRVLHVCENRDVLGAPFLIMERLPGSVMLDPLGSMDPPILKLLLLMPQTAFRMPDAIASLLVRLHHLNPRPLIERLRSERLPVDLVGLDARLERLGNQANECGLVGFAEASEWVCDHRPREPERVAICHGDMWFGNVIQNGVTVTGVVDWSAELVCVGDPMYDVGIASVILKCGMADFPGPLRAVARVVQGYVANRLVRAYARGQAVDPHSLRYYELLRCFEFLSWVAARRIDRSLQTREQREDMLEVQGSTESFVRYFHGATGIELHIPPRAAVH